MLNSLLARQGFRAEPGEEEDLDRCGAERFNRAQNELPQLTAQELRGKLRDSESVRTELRRSTTTRNIDS